MPRNAVRASVRWSTQTNAHFFTLVAGLTMLGWALAWLALGVVPLALLLGCAASLMGALLVLWARGAYAWVPHVVVASAIGAIVALVALSGGIAGQLALWLYLLPIGISLLLGVRASLIWNALAGLAVVSLALAGAAGVHFPDLIPPEQALGITLASSISAVLVILLLSMFYAWSQENALRRARALHETEAALTQRAKELKVLNDIGRVLVSEHSLDDLYRAMYAEVGRVLRCDAFYVAIWDEARKRIRFPFMMDEGEEYGSGPEMPLDEGPTSRAICERRTVLRSEGDAALPSGSWGNTARSSRAAIHAPMMKDGRVLGVLSVQNYAEPYDADDVRLLEALADQAAVAVSNALLYEHLSASEARFRELTEAIARMDGHAVVVTDLAGNITYAAGTGTTHGFPPESIIGKPVQVLGRNVPDADETTAAYTEASLAERPWTQFSQATHADGTNFPILLSCSPYYGAGGKIVGTVTIGRDLTRERQSQERLLQSAKLASIGELVAGIAHELNNPLTVVKSTAYLLRDEVEGAAAEDVRMIAEAAERAVRIVRGLLHFSRQTPARRAPTSLGDVVERVLRFREDALRANGVTIVRELAPDLPDVCADSAQLEQVLLNLLNNAEQAMREGGGDGRVAIRGEQRGAMLRLSVADSGPGIGPELLPRIFDPFFTTRPVGEGTGLGLALSHGIISEHGGAIWAESTPGAGAVFHVELPLGEGDAPAPAQAEDEHARTERSARPQRVLVVDDEAAIRQSLGRYLTRRGHQVDEAGSGEEALRQMAEVAYDAILLDLKMVGMSGYELYAVLREHWPEIASRVRFATGDVVSPETLAFLEATGRPYFEKPYTLAEVAEEIEASEPSLEP